MSVWSEIKANCGKYFRFDKEEIKTIIILALAFGFMFSFKEWGVDQFEVVSGLLNWLNTSIIALLSILVSVTAYKVAALYYGFKAEIKIWWYGIIFGLLIVFVTRGNLFFLAGMGVMYHHLAALRLGVFRYGLNYWDQAKCTYAAALATLLLAMLLKIFSAGAVVVPVGIAGPALIEKAIQFNLWYVVFSLLPIPPLPGTVAFYASRTWYVFVYGCILGYSILVLGAGIYSTIATLAGGLVLVTLFYLFFERGAM